MNGLDDSDVEILRRAGTALTVLFVGAAVVGFVGWLVNR